MSDKTSHEIIDDFDTLRMKLRTVVLDAFECKGISQTEFMMMKRVSEEMERTSLEMI